MPLNDSCTKDRSTPTLLASLRNSWAKTQYSGLLGRNRNTSGGAFISSLIANPSFKELMYDFKGLLVGSSSMLVNVNEEIPLTP